MADFPLTSKPVRPDAVWLKALLAACAFAFLVFGGQTIAAEPYQDFDCLTRLADVRNPPAFHDYPAVPARMRPAKVQLTSPDARRMRTVLREGAAKGPNFAGHFSVVVWGCGSSCSDLAIVDARSGRVFFDESVDDISGVHVGDEPGASDWAARFRLDSRLLAIVGAPNENDARDGVTFYEWTGARLKLLRFVPRKEACTPVSRDR